MEKFKKDWEITKNWQLLFPLFGIIALIYSSLKIITAITPNLNKYIIYGLTAVLTYLLLKVTLKLFKRLENKWVVKERWEIIRIFIVFGLTGSTSVFIVRKQLFPLIGITKENLNSFIYYTLYIVLAMVFYQILLVIYGWLLGQFAFFWEFEKKMLRRFGLGRFLD